MLHLLHVRRYAYVRRSVDISFSAHVAPVKLPTERIEASKPIRLFVHKMKQNNCLWLWISINQCQAAQSVSICRTNKQNIANRRFIRKLWLKQKRIVIGSFFSGNRIQFNSSTIHSHSHIPMIHASRTLDR